MPEITVLQVGKPYNPDIQEWPEAAEYAYREGMHEFFVMYKNVTEEEAESFAAGGIQFALTLHLGLIFFSAKFGPDMGWAEGCFTIHRVPPETRGDLPPHVSGEERGFIHCYLVDADTGILKAMRHVTMSPEFTRELNAAIHMQISATAPTEKYVHTVALEMFANYTPEQLSMRAKVRCNGGD